MQTSVLTNYPAGVRRKVHRPQRVQFHDALPKTNVGKILRRELQVGAH